MGKAKQLKKMRKAIATSLDNMPFLVRKAKEKQYVSAEQYFSIMKLEGKEELEKAEALYRKATNRNLPGIPLSNEVSTPVNYARGYKKAFLKDPKNGLVSYSERIYDIATRIKNSDKDANGTKTES